MTVTDNTGLKSEVSARLGAMRFDGPAWECDPRLREYALAVAGDPGGHNVYEQLAVERFGSMLGRYEFRPGAVRNFVRFYERVRFSGVDGRRRYRLTPVQVFMVAGIFGFADARGRRLTRNAYIFVPRKFGKTTFAAALAVWDVIFGDSNAQAYVGANSYEQAKICFDEIRAVMREFDPGGRHLRVNREKITFVDGTRSALARCLTANAKTQDGLNASLVIMDEYAQARNTAGRNGADLKNVLTSSMGARREPLTVVISTASEVVDGPFRHELDGVQAVLRGEIVNDTVFASLFMPDEGDAEDDPRTWAKVQPHMGVTVQPDFYAREWANAQLSAENMMVFRTKLLNVFAAGEREMWFDEEKARSLLGGFDISRASGMDCAVAFDLSVRDDFSAVSYTCYSGGRFYVHTDYYFPRGALAGHRNRALYERWAEDGWLRLCEGDIIDVRRIGEDILERGKRVRIIRVGYDAWKAQDLTNFLLAAGGHGVLTPYKQTLGAFNLPVESFELLAWHDPPLVEMNANPINAWCLCNCVMDEDNLGNRKPRKATQWRKIDGVVTMLMTLGLLYNVRR